MHEAEFYDQVQNYYGHTELMAYAEEILAHHAGDFDAATQAVNDDPEEVSENFLNRIDDENLNRLQSTLVQGMIKNHGHYWSQILWDEFTIHKFGE